MTLTVTHDGMTHAVRGLRDVPPSMTFQFLWFLCMTEGAASGEGVVGYPDDPPRPVTCMACLALEPT